MQPFRQKPAADHWSPDADFGGRRVHVIEFDRMKRRNDDEETAQTIAFMHLLATRDADSATVRNAADQCSRDTSTPLELAQRIFDYARRTVEYRDDSDLRTPFSTPEVIYDQTLITPAALLSMPRPVGNCVIFSMLVASLCRACGLPTAYRTIAADPASLDYSHVYVVAQLEPGTFYVLDASNAPAAGWEFDLPKGKKVRTWPNPADIENPSMIQPPAPTIDTNGLTCNEMTALIAKGLNVGQRIAKIGSTLGDVTQDAIDAAWLDYGVDLTPSTGTGWGDIFTKVVDNATKIAAPLIRQNSIQAPYYISGPNGSAILYDPSTGKTANAGAASQRTPAVLSQNLLIGAGVAAALFFAFTASQNRK